MAISLGGLTFANGTNPNQAYNAAAAVRQVAGPVNPGYTQPKAVLGANTGPTGSGGGSSTASNSAVGSTNFNSAPQIPTPQQPNVDFDALIAPALQGLESAIGPLQESYNANVGSINTAHDQQAAYNQQNITDQQNQLGNAATGQQTQATNAADEARRQYAEIQQGLQSRYGGTTGTGAFASELAGRQTLQNIGQTHQQLSQALLQIDQKKQQVIEVGRIAHDQLENQTRDQLNQAKAQLDTAVADIRRQQGALQSQKAQMAANAIQIYQQTVNQVNAQNAAFKQQLYAAQLNAQQQLDAARQNGMSATNSFVNSIPGITAANQATPVGQGDQTNTSQSLGGGNLYNDLLKKYNLGNSIQQ